MPVYQHWDPLKTCMVGKSYPPEFYSWIENTKARNAMERIAIETEEDYQSLIKILKSFDVDVIRPSIDTNYEKNFNTTYQKFNIPPMTPRDYIGTFGSNVFIEYISPSYLINFYNTVKDELWPNISSDKDIHLLPQQIQNELYLNFNLSKEISISTSDSLLYNAKHSIINALSKNNININYVEDMLINNAGVCRVGKDLYYPGDFNISPSSIKKYVGEEYRINFYDGLGHADSCFCPVVPGLIISLRDFQNYKETFPSWEVVELPHQSWSKVKPFLELKKKNKGKWWIPGEEGNDALFDVVENWLDNWVGYVEETVFDVNMLVIDDQNVIVNNYNKKVFDALERYNVSPHICNFRHRYFWDGGIHCITADLERVGEMKDYFPERGEY